MSDTAQIHASLRQRWRLLAAAVVIGGCGGFAYAHLAPTTYAAPAYVVVKPRAVANQQAPADNTLAVNFAQAFGRIITQDDVMGPASRDVSYVGPDFAKHIQATTSPDAPLIKIVGTAPTPDKAAAYANAVVTSLVTYGNLEASQTGVTLASLSLATPPAGPSSPNGTMDIAVGAATGLLVGALATMVRRELKPGGDRAAEAAASSGEPPREPDEAAERPERRPHARPTARRRSEPDKPESGEADSSDEVFPPYGTPRLFTPGRPDADITDTIVPRGVSRRYQDRVAAGGRDEDDARSREKPREGGADKDADAAGSGTSGGGSSSSSRPGRPPVSPRGRSGASSGGASRADSGDESDPVGVRRGRP